MRRRRTKWTICPSAGPRRIGNRRRGSSSTNGGRADWFSAGDGEPEWPAFAKPRRKDHTDREPSKDRVRYLFPVPDATDWSVGELRYERKTSG
jgi:hypothetical protein